MKNHADTQVKWLCSRLKEIRCLKVLPLQAVADQMGVKRSRIGETENAKWDIRASTLFLHADALGWQVPWLLETAPDSAGNLQVYGADEIRNGLKSTLQIEPKFLDKVIDFANKSQVFGHYVSRQISNCSRDGDLTLRQASRAILIENAFAKDPSFDELGYTEMIMNGVNLHDLPSKPSVNMPASEKKKLIKELMAAGFSAKEAIELLAK